MAGSFEVHGEAILDGDADAGIAVILYEKGSVTVRTLAAGEFLHVVDAQLYCETGGNISLVADSLAAGRYLVHGTVNAKGGMIVHFNRPYTCPRGTGLKFWGASTNLNSCLIEGFITEA